MSQTRVVRGVATNVRRDKDGTLYVRYHMTDVVTVKPDGTVVLDTGGWRTATTKVRMNQAANQFGLNLSVYQEKGEWYVRSIDDRWPWTIRFEGEQVTLPAARLGSGMAS